MAVDDAHEATGFRLGLRWIKKIPLWWAVIAFLAVWFILIIGSLVYLAIHADRLAAEIVVGIPIEQENILGDLALVDIRSKMRLHDSGKAVEAVRTIGERLTVGSRLKYRWYVGERSQINAFSIPGGVVVVYSGLIEAASSPEELAGVLAHEVAHAELRHGLRASVKGIGLTGLFRLMLGDSSVAGWAGHLGGLKFSREHEAEADADGLKRLLAAGVDPNGMVRIYEKLARPAATGSAMVSALNATHPAIDDRIVELNTAIKRLISSTGTQSPPFVSFGIDWPAVQGSLSRPAS